MPTKQKNQHLIPRCYLANFISSQVPPEQQTNPQFERGIWTTPPTLEEEWKLQGIRKLLSRSYAYALPGDTPHDQKIESYLSTIETPWPNIMQTLAAGQMLSVDQEAGLRLFVSTLYQRSDAAMAMVKGWTDSIEKLYRMVERAHTGAESAADDVFAAAPHIPKSLIMDAVLDGALRNHRLHFLRNETSSPWLTSDAPVSLTHRHPDEIAALLPSLKLIKSGATTNLRGPLVLCPLTPTLMLLASGFVEAEYPGFPFLTIDDPRQVTLLNLLTIENAQDLLLSSLRAPFGDAQAKMAALLRTVSHGAHTRGAWMLLYTNRRRYWLSLEDFQHEIQELTFQTLDVERLRQATEDESLESVQIFVDGCERGGMREIRFEHIDLKGTGPSRIGSRIKLPFKR